MLSVLKVSVSPAFTKLLSNAALTVKLTSLPSSAALTIPLLSASVVMLTAIVGTALAGTSTTKACVATPKAP